MKNAYISIISAIAAIFQTMPTDMMHDTAAPTIAAMWAQVSSAVSGFVTDTLAGTHTQHITAAITMLNQQQKKTSGSRLAVLSGSRVYAVSPCVLLESGIEKTKGKIPAVLEKCTDDPTQDQREKIMKIHDNCAEKLKNSASVCVRIYDVIDEIAKILAISPEIRYYHIPGTPVWVDAEIFLRLFTAVSDTMSITVDYTDGKNCIAMRGDSRAIAYLMPMQVNAHAQTAYQSALDFWTKPAQPVAAAPETPADDAADLPWWADDVDTDPAIDLADYAASVPEKPEAPEMPEAPEAKELPTPPVDPEELEAPGKKVYTVDDLHSIMHTTAAHITYRKNRQSADPVYGADFVQGAYYMIPRSRMKSAAAEILIRIDRHTGKSVSITSWERYNGKITENSHKNKKLNPGSKFYWIYVDPDTGKPMNRSKMSSDDETRCIYFQYWDAFDLEKVSRWCTGTLSCISAIPVSADDAAAFIAHTAPTATQPSSSAAPPVETRTVGQGYAPTVYTSPEKFYYPVSEKLAKMHKEAISFYDYKPGSVTAEYKKYIDSAFDAAMASDDPEKSVYLLDIFAKMLARWYNDFNRNGASCPSVLIAGPANFPTRKNERQNARADALMAQWQKLMAMKDKIARPHGSGVEIRRDTITAEEFENLLYFSVKIAEKENRIQLIFDEKPEEETRAILKKHGFRWSARFGAWQRQLTENAVSAVWSVVDALDSLETAAAESAAAEAAKIAAVHDAA